MNEILAVNSLSGIDMPLNKPNLQGDHSKNIIFGDHSSSCS